MIEHTIAKDVNERVQFKTVSELAKFCKSFRYGVRTKSGNYVTKKNDFNKQPWVLQSPEQVAINKIGICWDVTLFISTHLKNMKIPHSCFFIWNNDESGNLENTHSFNIFEQNAKYYVFDVFGPSAGISEEFNSQLAAVKYRVHNWIKEEAIKTETHCTRLSSFPSPGSSPAQFIHYATAQSYVTLGISDATEAMTANQDIDKFANKKQRIIAYYVKLMNKLDPSGDNGERVKKLLDPMNEKQFTQFMEMIRAGEYQSYIVMPNMVKTFKMTDIFEAARFANYKFMHKLWLTDPITKRKFLTNEEYMILQIPLRRAQQEVDKKLSVPSSDRRIDALTGQVTGPDKACSISTVEMRALHTRGLGDVLHELVRVRGGDILAYGDFKRQLEETGEVSLENLNRSSRSRSAVVAGVLFKAVLIDNNL